jgi:hypothetical protein
VTHGIREAADLTDGVAARHQARSSMILEQIGIANVGLEPSISCAATHRASGTRRRGVLRSSGNLRGGRQTYAAPPRQRSKGREFASNPRRRFPGSDQICRRFKCFRH